MDLITGDIGLHAAPVIARDVIIVGAAHTEGSRPESRRNEKGYVRGFDVRTGKRLWIFHTIPEPGEFGNDTWEGLEAYTGNAGVWAQMSVDEELGTVFLPVEMPTGDYYGGHRPGDGPLRREPRRGRSQDRQAQVALPVHSSRHLGLGSAVRADLADVTSTAHATRRGAADQAGLALRVRSRDRRADLADRGAAGRRATCREKRMADAAVRDQAAGVRASGRLDRRPDRLHAGAARRSGEAGLALQDRSDLHAARGQHVAGVRWRR